MTSQATPCGVLFDAMKRFGGVSHKELSRLILSGRPLTDGKSPLSRSDDRTWVSRFIVHAPVGSLQERYFCDWGVGALRICARLRSNEGRNLSPEAVLDLVYRQTAEPMREALSACSQNVTLYDNTMECVAHGAGFTVEERAELAMVMFVAVACCANVKRAVAYLNEYVRSIHGGRLVTVSASVGDTSAAAPLVQARALGVLRVMDGLVAGDIHWAQPETAGLEIGALALGDNDVTNVGPGVSSHHVRLFCNDEGVWQVQDLGSREGTVLVSGVDRSETVIAEAGRKFAEPSEPFEVRPGDELILAGTTRYLLIEGIAE